MQFMQTLQEYTLVKQFLNLSTIDKVQLKCNFNNVNSVNGLRQPEEVQFRFR